MRGKAIHDVADRWGQAIDPRLAFPQKFPLELDDRLQHIDLDLSEFKDVNEIVVAVEGKAKAKGKAE